MGISFALQQFHLEEGQSNSHYNVVVIVFDVSWLCWDHCVLTYSAEWYTDSCVLTVET
jgi:hypothetical protein